MKVHISNLGGNVKDEDLHKLFASFGEVKSINLIMDRETGGGFAFVEMTDETAADLAVSELNNSLLDGRTIRVCQAGHEGQKGSAMYEAKVQPAKNRHPYRGF